MKKAFEYFAEVLLYRTILVENVYISLACYLLLSYLA